MHQARLPSLERKGNGKDWEFLRPFSVWVTQEGYIRCVGHYGDWEAVPLFLIKVGASRSGILLGFWGLPPIQLPLP